MAPRSDEHYDISRILHIAKYHYSLEQSGLLVSSPVEQNSATCAPALLTTISEVFMTMKLDASMIFSKSAKQFRTSKQNIIAHIHRGKNHVS